MVSSSDRSASVEQAHAPLDGGPQGALALGQVHRTRSQRVERPRQPAQQRVGLEQPGAGGGQLDGQRQALQAPADLRHRRRVVLGEGEVVAHRAGPVDEQRHRRRRRQLLERHAAGLGRQRQRRHRVLPLGPQLQHRAAGGQDRHAGTAGQQLVEVAGGVDHLLQVVEDQQPPVVAELLDQGLQRRVRPRQVGADRPGDAGQDQLGLGHRRQRDEHDARGEAVTQPVRRRRSPAGSCRSHPARSASPAARRARSSTPATSSMARSRPTSDVAATGSGRGPRGAAAAPAGGAGGGEPLAQQHREVVAHQPAELRGRAEVRNDASPRCGRSARPVEAHAPAPAP